VEGATSQGWVEAKNFSRWVKRTLGPVDSGLKWRLVAVGPEIREEIDDEQLDLVPLHEHEGVA